MALHIRLGRRRSHLGLHAVPSLAHSPHSLLSASMIPRITQKTTPFMHAIIRTSIPKRADPIVRSLSRPTRISTIPHEGGASCITPSLCDC